MKKTKVLLTLACAILLVAASVMGTLAWLTDTAEVNNTFTVGNVDLGDEGEAGLDEAKVNKDGVPVLADGTTTTTKANAPRVTSNVYKLVPGHNYTKDPTIHVASGSEDCYLFVKVENGIKDIEADDDNTIADQMAALGWVQVDGVENVYALHTFDKDGKDEGRKTVKAGADEVVFNEFTLAGNADVSGYANAEIKITAYAVQVDGLTDKTDAVIWADTFAASATPIVPDAPVVPGDGGETPEVGE